MIVATAVQSVLRRDDSAPPLDPSPHLRHKKTRKFMGVQDDLAVIAAGLALAEAGLARESLGERAGLFAVVGYIPFNQSDIAPVLAASIEDGRFSMARFSNGGFQQAHPLLTFRCLPNMPAYHVSANYDVRGPYFVTYPGPGQLYAALEEATLSLAERRVDVALVLGVAHQRNFLVEHHFDRIEAKVAPAELCDVGACLLLERDESARARGCRARLSLLELEHAYRPHSALSGQTAQQERFSGVSAPRGALGPAALLCALSDALKARADHEVLHELCSSDQITARSRWQVLP
jgi:3-oxoacyl-[acyl-carrier-protein] synthase II